MSLKEKKLPISCNKIKLRDLKILTLKPSIKEYLPNQRKRKYDLRDIVDAILWILRIGSQWRNLPESFPLWKSVYYYFRKWIVEQTFGRLDKDHEKTVESSEAWVLWQNCQTILYRLE